MVEDKPCLMLCVIHCGAEGAQAHGHMCSWIADHNCIRNAIKQRSPVCLCGTVVACRTLNIALTV